VPTFGGWPDERPLPGMWFVFDYLGMALSSLTWVLLAFADWVVVRHVLLTWFTSEQPRFSWLHLTDVGLVLCGMYQMLLFLSWFSHLRAMTTDPGTINIKSAPKELQNPRVCKLCGEGWKPPRAHHCKVCHRCIFRMDHHCPWVNNCVGFSNQKLFILFLVYTSASAVVTLLILFFSASFWLWSQKSWLDAAPPGSQALICSGIVAVECLAAILFVHDFLSEQIESIETNSTLVETYQRTHGERTTFWGHFRTVFGHNWLLWPLPFRTHLPPNYLEPAIPDDQDRYPNTREDEDIGIAGEESEAHSPSSGGAARPRPGWRMENAD